MKGGVSVCIAVLLLSGGLLHAQPRARDLQCWGWFQVHKDLGNRHYAEWQIQLRFNNNISDFSRTNIYFLHGWKLSPAFTTEALYQFATSYTQDRHTFFADLIWKKRISKRSYAYLRTAFQYSRQHLSREGYQDNPYLEWRNRLRIQYVASRNLKLTFSGEPYLKFAPGMSPVLSRIRFVMSAIVKLNDYQNLSPFFLFEPDVTAMKHPRNDYVLGLTWSIRLPDKLSRISNVFRFASAQEEKQPVVFADMIP